jgi:hypothetical protein
MSLDIYATRLLEEPLRLAALYRKRSFSVLSGKVVPKSKFQNLTYSVRFGTFVI